MICLRELRPVRTCTRPHSERDSIARARQAGRQAGLERTRLAGVTSDKRARMQDNDDDGDGPWILLPRRVAHCFCVHDGAAVRQGNVTLCSSSPLTPNKACKVAAAPALMAAANCACDDAAAIQGRSDEDVFVWLAVACMRQSSQPFEATDANNRVAVRTSGQPTSCHARSRLLLLLRLAQRDPFALLRVHLSRRIVLPKTDRIQRVSRATESLLTRSAHVDTKRIVSRLLAEQQLPLCMYSFGSSHAYV